ncbi:unnamed protein product [Musa acuminata var. zebrina]
MVRFHQPYPLGCLPFFSIVFDSSTKTAKTSKGSMGVISLTGRMSKSFHLAASMARCNSRSPRFLAFAATRGLQGSAERDAKETHKNIKDASAEIKKTAENVREKINAATDQVVDKTIEAAGNVTDSVQGGRAKGVSQSAWGSAKETMQKIKDTVVGKAQESKQSIKDGAENTKRAMDAKH